MNNGANGYVSANDSAGKKTNTSKWSDEAAVIFYNKVASEKKYYPDSSVHTAHRRPFTQPWQRDLGNLGSPAANLFFTPQNTAGLSLGYHAFDIYRFNVDDLPYYNTTRPYSDFTYQLGSKLEQTAQILHTQNIKPYWNFAVNYRKINSAGYYAVQRNNHDNFFATTSYASPSQHYKVFLAFTYNKEQHDENGGIVSDSFLNLNSYSDRKSIPAKFQEPTYSTVRSPVTNMLRDFSIVLNHGYTWGRTDTLYNEDSTHYTYHLTPRFRISHRAEFSSQKHLYKDLRPDSLSYSDFFQQSFAGTDSVYIQQNWNYLDNRVVINGLLGKASNQLLFNAGIGNRVDQFKTSYLTGSRSEDIISNYVTGEVRKEALEQGQWDYSANAKFFLTGDASGNFELNAAIGKDLGKDWGSLKIGASQQLNNAPYSYRVYQNQYWSRFLSFDKESITQLYATVNSPKYHVSLGARNYLLNNYLYFGQDWKPAQYTTTFTVAQLWLRKLFNFGIFTLDNELTYQQVPEAAPVNIPALLGRHQLSIERTVFGSRLKIATGVELRYHSSYYAPGYTPFFNQFTYQNSYYVSNTPEASVFFNFRIKRFRAYIMADQVQQMFTRNTIISSGYAAQNLMIRFGFNWVLIN